MVGIKFLAKGAKYMGVCVQCDAPHHIPGTLFAFFGVVTNITFVTFKEVM